MTFNQINISFSVFSFFQENGQMSFKEINVVLKGQSGIVDFFEKEDDYAQLKQKIGITQSVVCKSRTEFGDFQGR
ncbi:hypothetical protein FACS189413_02500 [Bacteroidia bacterium]|nr:hypothetical protein FACS189413_02500 [Bacteroidia bacterium]